MALFLAAQRVARRCYLSVPRRCFRATSAAFSPINKNSGDNFDWDTILPPLGHDQPRHFEEDEEGPIPTTDQFMDTREDEPLLDKSLDYGSGVGSFSSSPSGGRTKKARPDGSYGFNGGRKRARAFVSMKPATSELDSADFKVNGKSLADYFGDMNARRAAVAPIILTSTHTDFVYRATVSGGGKQGQAEALRQALAHGIRFFKPEYRKLLRVAGFVTRDRRIVEPKKPGRRKARKLKTKPYR